MHYFPRMRKATSRSSNLFRSQEALRILLCETVNSCWQLTQSKHHVRVPKPRGSYCLVNNSVRSHNHTMSVTLNLGAVGIILPASKPAHSVSQAIIFTSYLREPFDFADLDDCACYVDLMWFVELTVFVSVCVSVRLRVALNLLMVVLHVLLLG